MQVFAFLLTLCLACFAAAIPALDRRTTLTKNFYLVATPTKSAHPTNTSEIDLVDPYYQANFLLRVTPGDPSYLKFNLTNGILSAISSPPHIYTEYDPYESNIDLSTGSIYFANSTGTKGLFSFKDNYLAYKGSVQGFTICIGELEQPVINYKGTDASCTPTYIYQQATSSSS